MNFDLQLDLCTDYMDLTGKMRVLAQMDRKKLEEMGIKLCPQIHKSKAAKIKSH